jgi:hypothetical protein
MIRWLLFAVVLVACSPAKPEPEGLVPRDTFVQVLADLQLVEARIHQELMLQPVGRIASDAYAEEVFAKRGVSQAAFKESFTYYASDNAVMTAIYEDVIAELSQRKDSVGQAEPVK